MRKDRELHSLNQVIEMFKSLYNTECVIESEYSKHDLNAFKNGEFYGCLEVKQRNFTPQQIKKYSEEGFMLEGIKYDYLKDKRSLYINYFEIDGKFAIIM